MIYVSLVQYIQHKFLTAICVIQYKENCLCFRESLNLLCSLSKLYHETDCYLFGEYIHKNLLRNDLGARTILMLPRETYPRTHSPANRKIQSLQL